MSAIRIYDSVLTITIGETAYEVPHYNSVEIESPERVRKVRGANAGDKIGITYKEGLTEATTITVTIVDCPAELHTALAQGFEDATPMKVECISESDSSQVVASDCVLSRAPHQLSIADGAESMNLELLFETFDVVTEYK
jgi:hypothetical protein